MRKLNVMLTPLMIEERSNVEVRGCARVYSRSPS